MKVESILVLECKGQGHGALKGTYTSKYLIYDIFKLPSELGCTRYPVVFQIFYLLCFMQEGGKF